MHSFKLRLAVLLVLGAPAAAQLNTTVGPRIVPSDCRVSITFSNDTPGKFGVVVPLYEVLDDGGNLVFTPEGPQTALLMASGGWTTIYWDLVDAGGHLVPAGEYTLMVRYDTGVPAAAYPVTVVEQGAGLVFEGTPTTRPPFFPGSYRNFSLCSPDDAGFTYVLLASLSSDSGIATCNGLLPLDPDSVFFLSVKPQKVFQNSIGVLDGSGLSSSPQFRLPNDPTLIGVSVESAFFVLDATSPCSVRRISNRHTLTIV